MVTRLMFEKGSIAFRIALGYLAVVLLTGLLLGSSFWLLLNRHLENAARENLRQDVQRVVEMVHSLPGENTWQRGMMMHRLMSYHMLGRVVQGEYLLVNPRGIVIESSIKKIPAGSILDPAVVNAIASAEMYEGRVTLDDERFVAAARYVSARGGTIVLLLTRVEGLAEIRNELLLIFLASLGASSLAALALALLLARRISRPLELLREKTRQVARRNFGWRVNVDSGDEIGELGRAINAMDEKLAEYDRAQKQFFQNASHELKSPLMSIQGYAEGIRDGVFRGREAEKALDNIVHESGRLKKLVEELVYLGKLEGPSEVYHFEETELQEVLEQAVESQRVLAVEKGVRLELETCPDVCLRADGEKLVRVFVNLIANGLRHAATTVKVTAVREGEKVKVTVRDDGTGFTGEDLRRLWDRFYKGPRGGSGLGLSIAKTIVEEHRGTIQARNVPGGGAEIVVELPVVHCYSETL